MTDLKEQKSLFEMKKINIIELLLSFPTNLKSTKLEFRWRNYCQNTISAQQNYKSAVHNLKIMVSNSRTQVLSTLFFSMPKLRIIIIKFQTTIIDTWGVNLYFEIGYSLKLKGFTPLHPKYYWTSMKIDL
jgi:hypothetical protein